MAKEKEPKEIEVLTTELVEQLDETVKEDIVLLTERLGDKGMLPLNPLVSTYQGLLKHRELKYEVKMDEDGKEQDNSQDYKDAKGEIRSFRATVGKTKKMMKADIIATGKALDNIEKTFIEQATEIHDELDANFKEYLDAVEKKKAEAQAKKEKARNEEIERLNAEKNDALLKAKKAGAMNKIKYDVLLAYKEKKNNELATLNVKAIDHNIVKFNAFKMTDLILEAGAMDDWDMLEDHEQLSMHTQFKSIIKDLVANFEAKKVLVAEEDLKRAEKLAEEQKAKQVEEVDNTPQAMMSPTVPVPPVPPSPPRAEESKFELSKFNLEFLQKQTEVQTLIKYFNDFIDYQKPPATIATMIIEIRQNLEQAEESIDDLIM